MFFKSQLMKNTFEKHGLKLRFQRRNEKSDKCKKMINQSGNISYITYYYIYYNIIGFIYIIIFNLQELN